MTSRDCAAAHMVRSVVFGAGRFGNELNFLFNLPYLYQAGGDGGLRCLDPHPDFVAGVPSAIKEVTLWLRRWLRQIHGGSCDTSLCGLDMGRGSPRCFLKKTVHSGRYAGCWQPGGHVMIWEQIPNRPDRFHYVLNMTAEEQLTMAIYGKQLGQEIGVRYRTVRPDREHPSLIDMLRPHVLDMAAQFGWKVAGLSRSGAIVHNQYDPYEEDGETRLHSVASVLRPTGWQDCEDALRQIGLLSVHYLLFTDWDELRQHPCWQDELEVPIKEMLDFLDTDFQPRPWLEWGD